MERPTPKSEGGHFEPMKHADETRIRDTDSEYKILSDLADQIEARGITNPAGKIKLYTERAPCDSCDGIINQFRAKYPGVKVQTSRTSR